MIFLKKISEYLCNIGHVFLCWAIFAITTTILCAVVWSWISSNKNDSRIEGDSKTLNRIDTIYVVVKPEIDELRVSAHLENKDSIWIAPIKASSRIIVKEETVRE